LGYFLPLIGFAVKLLRLSVSYASAFFGFPALYKAIITALELWLAHETKNMILNAEIILRSSLFRKESRGTHYREDYPERKDPDWLAWTKIKDEEGEMKVWKQQLPKEWQPDLTKSNEEVYYSM
jgi:hypothetical protein